MVDTTELTELISALRAETEADSVSPERVGYVLQRIVEEFPSARAQLNAIKGFRVIESTDELPAEPTGNERMLGYLLGTVLYVYVGEGGDTLDGKWQSADLRGPQGLPGVNLGDVVLVNDLTTGGEEAPLSAEMGKVLKSGLAGLEEVVDGLEDELSEEVTDVPTLDRTGMNGVFINADTNLIKTGGSDYCIWYFAVQPGDVVNITFDNYVNTPADVVAAGAWFSDALSVGAAGDLLESNNTVLKLLNAIGNSYQFTAPAGASYMGLAGRYENNVWKLPTVSRTRKVVSVVHQDEFASLESEVDSLETEVSTIENDIDEFTEVVDVELESTRLGSYYLNTSSQIRGAAITGSYYLFYWPVSAGKQLKLVLNGNSTAINSVTAAAWFENTPAANANGTTALVDNNAAMLLKDADGTHTLTVPQGVNYLAVSTLGGNTPGSASLYASKRIIPSTVDKVEWSVPSTLYAIVGEEKRVYLDCIVKDFGRLVISLGGGEHFIKPTNDSLLYINQGCLIYTPTQAGSVTVTLDAYDLSGVKQGSKTLTITAIAKQLPSSTKRVCIIGDSITEIWNMAWYIEQKFQSLFPDSENLPIFVGSKRGEYNVLNNKMTRYEGWYGKYYNWLISSSSSPMVYNGQLNIAHWRTADGNFTGNSHISDGKGCGLASNEKVDVVSLAMGSNMTANDAEAQVELAALKTLIAAFKSDNPNVVIVVHLNTLLGYGAGVDPWMTKLLTRYKWRDLLLNDEDLANDSHVIIGDLGCCYDRYRAYNHVTVQAAPQYEDTIEVFKVAGDANFSNLDIQHPNKEGEQQLGENIVPVLLKALQQ